MASKFSEKLIELRKQKGLSQDELAQSIYVTRQAISKWENGLGAPDIENLKAIAAYFSVSVDYLINDEVPVKTTKEGEETEAEVEEKKEETPQIKPEPRFYKTEVNNNKKKFSLVLRIAAIIAGVFWIIGLFVPYYQVDRGAISVRFSLVDYMFDSQNIGYAMLYLFGIICLVIGGTFYLKLDGKGPKPLLQVILRPILGLVGLIMAIIGMAAAQPDTNMILDLGPAFFLNMIAGVLYCAIAILDSVTNYLLATGKVSEEKLFGVKKR